MVWGFAMPTVTKAHDLAELKSTFARLHGGDRLIDMVSFEEALAEKFCREVRSLGGAIILAKDIELGGLVPNDSEDGGPVIVITDTILISRPCEFQKSGGGCLRIDVLRQVPYPESSRPVYLPRPSAHPDAAPYHFQYAAPMEWYAASIKDIRRGFKDGGNLLLIARKLIVNPGGYLKFVSNSCEGRTKVRFLWAEGFEEEFRKRVPLPTGHGGNLVIAAERLEIPGIDADDFDRARKYILGSRLETAQTGKDGNGSLEIIKIRTSEFKDWLSSDVLGPWVEKRLNIAYQGFLAAEQSGSRKALVDALLDYRTIPIDGVNRPEERRMIERMNTRLEQFATVNRRTIPVRYKSTSTRQTVFTQGTGLENYLAPTELLVRSNTLSGRRVLGFLRIHPKDRDRLQISIDARLAVDPRLEAAAAGTLAASGESLAGVFRDWTLSPGVTPLGVDDLDVRAVDDTLQVTLSLARAQANVVLYRLAGETGLPLDLEYQARADPTVKGRLVLPLSLARRLDPELELAGGSVANRGKTELTVRYVALNGGRYVEIPGGLVVPPGERRPLGLPPGIDSAGASVPAEAVAATGLDPFSFDCFYVTAPRDLIETATVSNRLGRYDPRGEGRLNSPGREDTRGGGRLRRTTVWLAAVVGEGADAVEVDLGSHELAAQRRPLIERGGPVHHAAAGQGPAQGQGDRRIRQRPRCASGGGGRASDRAPRLDARRETEMRPERNDTRMAAIVLVVRDARANGPSSLQPGSPRRHGPTHSGDTDDLEPMAQALQHRCNRRSRSPGQFVSDLPLTCVFILAALAGVAAGPDDAAMQKRLLNFRPSEWVQKAVIAHGRDWAVHRVEDAAGPVNLDCYWVIVDKPPRVGGRQVSATGLLGYASRSLPGLRRLVASRLRPAHR